MGSSANRQRLSTAYAEIKRVDQLAGQESRRVDGRFEASETAVNAALIAQEKAVAAALAASEKAVDKSEIAQKAVNEGQNEFRATLKDQAATLMPRSETENLVRELRGLINAQGAEMAVLRSRLDVGPPSLQTLQTRSDEATGRNDQAARNQFRNQWTIERVIALMAVGLGALYFILVNYHPVPAT